ncbi:MAG: 23S rRNA (adenine(2503)-C(2))-methyltransferase RlmN [Christensenellales bacterium]
MVNVLDLSMDELKDVLARLNIKSFRAKQLYDACFQYKDYDEVSNISKAEKESLKNELSLLAVSIYKVQKSSDGTIKFALKCEDNSIIEAVLMSYKYGYTICVSTQVGCRMGCSFCASTRNGLIRNLKASEIVGQIICINKYINNSINNNLTNNIDSINVNNSLNEIDSINNCNLTNNNNSINDNLVDVDIYNSINNNLIDNNNSLYNSIKEINSVNNNSINKNSLNNSTNERKITNIVLMGCGEPLDNYENVSKFLNLITSSAYLNFSERNISISTCGIVPNIYKLADDGYKINLTISLHAPNDEIRKRLMKVANAYSIKEILKACDYYFDKTHRRIYFEYTLCRGVNDSDENAKELARLLKGRVAHINVIALNEVSEAKLESVTRKDAYKFCAILTEMGLSASVRRTLGADIDGACGQLRNKIIDEADNDDR